MAGDFAIEYERTDEGWVVFPRDAEYRRRFFDPEVSQHPAKFNLFLVESLVEYLTEPGDTVLDPFAGSGSTMIAALTGRNVTLIELEEPYLATLKRSWVKMGEAGATGQVQFLQGDCRQVLPVPADCVITSPPYSNLSVTQPLDHVGDILAYIKHPLNLGRLNDFYFIQAMERVYQGLAQSLPADGPMVIITRDKMEGDTRKLLSDGIIRQATRNGFYFGEWLKHKPPGSKQGKINRARGFKTVEDEDILLFRKRP